MTRRTAALTSVSWIPSEAVPGLYKLGFVLGVMHYDPPPPDRIDDLERLRRADRFRFANDLRAFIEVDDLGAITGAGYLGGGVMGASTIRVAGMPVTFPGVAFPDIRREPEHGDGWVRFVQTTGGRTGGPMPRRVDRPPWVRVSASTVWTTLVLTLHADGRVEREVTGASPFPRHWIYGEDGRLMQKSGTADFPRWMSDNYGDRDPWSDHDLAAIMADAETALERSLSALIMQGGTRPRLRRLGTGERLVTQGERGDDLFLVLDGVVGVEVDGREVAEAGPGAILGERALLEGGTRTSTLVARTPARVAVASAGQVDHAALGQLAAGHRREEGAAPAGEPA